MTYRVRDGAGAEESSFALSKALNEWMQNSGPSGLFKTCGNCRHVQKEGPAFCTKYNMTPPVEVILSGCPAHDDEHEIPF